MPAVKNHLLFERLHGRDRCHRWPLIPDRLIFVGAASSRDLKLCCRSQMHGLENILKAIYAESMQLDRIIKDFFASGYGHIAAVYLFGSCASERQRESSDVDIGLLLQSDAADLAGDVIEDILVKLPRLLRRDVHPVVMNTAPEELLRQIFDKGRCVLVNDDKTLAHFEMNAYAKIADFGYYRRRLQQGVIRNVSEGVPVG